MSERGQRIPAHLPPRDYWLVDPLKVEKIETPLDGRGLVDAFQAVAILRSFIAPEYRWSHLKDTHHEYHDAADYQDDEIEHTFRGTPINTDRLPRDAHDLWHYLLMKPAKPDRETMKLVADAFDLTTGLFTDAREVIRLERHKKRLVSGAFKPERKYKEFKSVASRERGIYFHQRRFEERLARYEALPREVMLADVDTSKNLPVIARHLGASAVIRSPVRNLSFALQKT